MLNDKQQILTTLRQEFNRWEELLAGMSDEQITDPSRCLDYGFSRIFHA